jgi:hypothetical protein
MNEINVTLTANDINSGYTKDTLDGVLSTSDNVRNYLEELLENKAEMPIKSKRELLADIQNFISENAYEYTRKAGNYLDAQLRSFFTPGGKPVFDESEISREAYDELFGPESYISGLKQKIDSRELFVLANNIKVYDEETGIAGEIDLLLIDTEGKLQIVDFKTGDQKKWNGFVEQTKAGRNKTEDYTLQQYTYARLLKKMTGLDAEINIMPLEITINQKEYKIASVKKPSNTELVGLNKWYFPLDSSFNNIKTKLDKEIDITEPVQPEETVIEITDLSDTEYNNFIDNGIVSQDRINAIAEKVKNNVELSEKETAIFNDKTAEINKILQEVKVEEEKQATKVSQLDLKKGDTVIVEKTIPGRKNDPDFASAGAVITVMETTEKGVRFTYMGRQKSLSLTEMDKFVTTIPIQKAKDAEVAEEKLDELDKELIADSIKVVKEFINSDTLIANAKGKADEKSLEDIYKDLLNDLDC